MNRSRNVDVDASDLLGAVDNYNDSAMATSIAIPEMKPIVILPPEDVGLSAAIVA